MDPSDDGKMSKVEKKLIKGNKKHMAKHGKKKEPEEAKKHAIIVTCMDARINPLNFGDFKDDQVYVCRNAGGRYTDDMSRSVTMAVRLFAVDQVLVVHHTDCGLEKVSDPEMRKLFAESLGPGHLHGDTASGKDNRDKYHHSDNVAYLAFEDLEKSVIDDVFKFRQDALFSKHVSLSGYIYNIETGELHKVKKATSPGEKC